VYPTVLSNDQQLQAHLDRLAGKPVFRGIQAEWFNWMSCFLPRRAGPARLHADRRHDFPGKDGKRVKLWDKGRGGAGRSE